MTARTFSELRADAEERDRQERWDRRYLEVARLVSTWSKDPSTKVGAVVVNSRGHIVGTGYNGFPVGVEDTDERLNDRPTKYALVVHAELNAVLQAGSQALGSTIYVYPAFGRPPLCTGCAKAVIQSGVRRVVGYLPDESNGHDAIARWSEEIEKSFGMCREAGLQMDMIAEAPDTLRDALLALHGEWGRSEMSGDELAGRLLEALR
jgi:dCMP deaminase